MSDRDGQLILRMPDGTEKLIAITAHYPKNHARYPGRMMPNFWMIEGGLATIKKVSSTSYAGESE